MTNFEEVIDKYLIKIPIIQRDYAQGRKSTAVKIIRDGFLESIQESLSQNKQLHLDFVYGSIKKGVFKPLDGQQRLTTIFLLYWYFGSKENKNIDFLTRFTYETRASSREFCKKIVNCTIDFENNNIASQIRDSSWFMPFWENDPTIQSMFTMINSIHKVFKNNEYYNRLNNITFEFFELDEFGLDDDLYIKMNARGKPLTDFENFKANFELFLEKKDVELKEEFSIKVDNDWANIFWEFRDDEYLIDDSFMNYFYYITDMLYYKSYSSTLSNVEANSFDVIKKVYANTDNVYFLFNSLDKMPAILKCFDSIFSSYTYEAGKVALFDKSSNLLEKVINGSFINLHQKTMLFIIIGHMVDYEVNERLINLIRVLRNLIERIRSLKSNNITYTNTYDNKALNKIISLFFPLIGRDIYKVLATEDVGIKGTTITKKSFNQEIEKAKLILSNGLFKKPIYTLEDYKYLKGDIHNFIANDLAILNSHSKNIPIIYSNSNDELIIRAMLANGDYRLHIGWSGGSRKYYFGSSGKWEVILTSENNEYFEAFMNDYVKNSSDLHAVIKSASTKFKRTSWIYYFVKYKELLTINDNLSVDDNTFAWFDDFRMEKMGGLNLNAFHINPYILAVASKLDLHYQTYTGDVYSTLKKYGKFSEFYPSNKGWYIKFSDMLDNFFVNTLISKYKLVDTGGGSYLLQFGDDDLIDIAVEFIGDVIK